MALKIFKSHILKIFFEVLRMKTAAKLQKKIYISYFSSTYPVSTPYICMYIIMHIANLNFLILSVVVALTAVEITRTVKRMDIACIIKKHNEILRSFEKIQ